MKERPILFSGPMVSAILAGEKTQTRRIIRINPYDGAFYLYGGWPHRSKDGETPRTDGKEEPYNCPYGAPGDRLWVRETWARSSDLVRPYVYAADPHVSRFDIDGEHWTPSIFMRRAASRIDLEVVSVRVQRLQEISGADVLAEGLGQPWNRIGIEQAGGMTPEIEAQLREKFSWGWDGINGDRGDWKSNPWVWVVEFKRIAA